MPATAPAASGGPGANDHSIPAFLRMPGADPTADQLDAETEAELAATARYGEDPDARIRPDPPRDLYVPLALLAVGIILTFIGFNIGGAIGFVIAAFATVVKLIVSLVLFVIGALLAARFASVCLGELGPALLKLAAVSIFPAALADLVTELLGGDMAVAMIGNTVGIVTCWGLVSYLFRLDGANTMAVVIAIAVVKFVLGFVLFALLALIVVSAAPSFDDSDLGADTESGEMSSVEDDDAGGDWED
jgi:hypothetical protein